MASYCQLLYHMVWATHRRQPAFFGADRRELYRYLYGILAANECHVYRIGGVEDHLHILAAAHQSTRLDYLVRDLKASSSKWMHSNGRFPQFERWQEGSGLFTVDWQRKDSLVEYIKNQEEHHKSESSLEEFQRLIRETGLEHLLQFEER